MTKYLLSRLLRGLLSVFIVVCIVMVLIYSCLDRNQIFASDPNYTKQQHNNRRIYEMQQWEKYGYVDYVPYADYLDELVAEGSLAAEDRSKVSSIAKNAASDSDAVAEYVAKFTKTYEDKGYTVVRLEGAKRGKQWVNGKKPALYAYKDVPLLTRVGKYFSGLITIDNIHKVEDEIEDRGLSFTLYDPVYGGEKFSPAIMGNGTQHKYLLYFDSQFPYVHQNLININLGKSYSVNKDVDVFDTMTAAQGSQLFSTVTYPKGLVESSADDLHSATYVSGSFGENSTLVIKERYVDNYTGVNIRLDGFSKVGYSFVIGIISVILSYLLAVPLGTMMALKKDKFVDKLGTFYIVFIIAVPSLAYIFMFKAIGQGIGLPTVFDSVNPTWLMYVLPIISLALPSVASLMKWLRRYMIDQMNSDYVKFARSNGLTEGEIFRKHIFKNAVIPIVHGIPGSILGSVVGAIITERVYVVPGAGNLLTEAINKFDNGVIVGVTLFYALLSVISIILGDILMSMVDPRINFSSKAR